MVVAPVITVVSCGKKGKATVPRYTPSYSAKKASTDGRIVTIPTPATAQKPYITYSNALPKVKDTYMYAAPQTKIITTYTVQNVSPTSVTLSLMVGDTPKLPNVTATIQAPTQNDLGIVLKDNMGTYYVGAPTTDNQVKEWINYNKKILGATTDKAIAIKKINEVLAGTDLYVRSITIEHRQVGEIQFITSPPTAMQSTAAPSQVITIDNHVFFSKLALSDGDTFILNDFTSGEQIRTIYTVNIDSQTKAITYDKNIGDAAATHPTGVVSNASTTGMVLSDYFAHTTQESGGAYIAKPTSNSSTVITWLNNNNIVRGTKDSKEAIQMVSQAFSNTNYKCSNVTLDNNDMVQYVTLITK